MKATTKTLSLADIKVQKLAADSGFSTVEEMLESALCDGVCPAICMEEFCEYSTDLEPDAENCPCEECGEHTVSSALIIMGFI